MSRDALVAVARESAARGPALLVAFRIADHTNRTGWAWPGVLTLAEETGYSKDTVLRALIALEEAGELFVERSKSRRGNRYRLRLLGVPGSTIEEAPDGSRSVAHGDSSTAENCRTGAADLSHHLAGSVAGSDPNRGNRRNLPASPGAVATRIGDAVDLDRSCPTCHGSRWVIPDGERDARPCPRCAP